MSNVELTYHENIVPYDRNELLNRLNHALRKPRYEHVVRVEQMAIKLAKLNDVDVEKASIGGLVHDYAKQRPAQDFIDAIKKYHLDKTLLDYGNAIWHGYVGWIFVKKELGIQDIDVLNAVKHHTIGAKHMTKLEQIVYMADYIEMGRQFPNVDKARKVTFDNLQNGVAYQTKHTLDYLIQNNKQVFPKMIDTYNAWVPKSNIK
ncbi:HD domain-containing protein [Philodulcilactobacillus myokoensis]|uniref:bis(5'-nucleosyl)-tetraphosphatase (symmetrical) n=1 Tax=Philodulcilactobacillus myokoensis TaxID=2929573 RepID=A0A9W6ESG7_9LACO|nr:bis(5'-nucleosyl)-tetraphosphatase (symmetrical) YqeK [Philodulcilactobacillus myokoensis]GLB46760.1 HD domain-containing protein [Philodulcilactobacillus myokoensis]